MAPKIKHQGGVGMQNPKNPTLKQEQTLAASVEAHIQPRKKPKK